MDWNHREYITPNTLTEGTIGPATWTATINQPTVWEQYLSTAGGAIGGAGTYTVGYEAELEPVVYWPDRRWIIEPGEEKLIYIDEHGDRWHVSVEENGSLTANKEDLEDWDPIAPPAGLLEELDKLAGVIDS